MDLRPVLADVDVVSVHALWQQQSAQVAARCRKGSVPYIVYPHGMLDPVIVGRTRWHRVLRRVQLTTYVRRHLRSAKAVVFTSPAELDKARTTVGGRCRNFVLLPYGTADPGRSVAAPTDGERGDRRVRLGYLGRFDQKKNLLALIEAVQALEDDVVLLDLVGPESAHKAEVAEQVRARGLEDSVRLHPQLDGDARFEFLRELDWLVLVSHQENFGRVISEALSVGTPVIVSDLVDTAAVVEEAGAGLVTGTTAQPIVATLRLASGLDERDQEEFRRRARRCYEDNFGFGPVVEALDHLLRLAASPSGRDPAAALPAPGPSETGGDGGSNARRTSRR